MKAERASSDASAAPKASISRCMRSFNTAGSPRMSLRVASRAERGLAASAAPSQCMGKKLIPAHRVDEAELVRRLGVEGLGEQQIFGCPGPPEAFRHEHRRPRLRHQAKIDERHGEARARRGVDQVAMEAQRRPDADRRALDRRDRAAFRIRERGDEPPPGKSEARRPAAPVRDREKVADVVAGGEDAALAADDERADARVFARPCPRTSISASYMALVIAFFFSGLARAAHTTPPRV